MHKKQWVRWRDRYKSGQLTTASVHRIKPIKKPLQANHCCKGSDVLRLV